MGIRETLNESPKVAYGLLAGCAIVVLGIVWAQTGSRRELSQAWFTVDDGKTYFADDISRVPPFVKDGRTAYGCDVFTCDGGKTKFVGYLIRYRPGAAGEFGALVKPSASQGAEVDEYYGRRDAIDARTREVKRPLTGDAGWVLARSGQEGASVTMVACPSGSGVPESVIP